MGKGSTGGLLSHPKASGVNWFRLQSNKAGPDMWPSAHAQAACFDYVRLPCNWLILHFKAQMSHCTRGVSMLLLLDAIIPGLQGATTVQELEATQVC